ncbi:MAG: PQQ-dependent sugar dehydrogenase [Deltaproteobacteria bacterium]
MMIKTLCLALSLVVPTLSWSEGLETSLGPVTLTKMADGLVEPWSIGFLPDGSFLVTLRGGELRHYEVDGSFVALGGVPEVVVRDQAGLFDVMVPRDFATSREIFISYAKSALGGSGTALARAILPDGATALEDVKVLFEMKPTVSGFGHYGGRIVEGVGGHIFLTLGERQKFTPAQDLAQHLGKIIRLNRDGSVPDDNPFVGQSGVQPEIWSYGHRNPQGATLDLNGQLWESEHGAMGGDEVNLIAPGQNYGWPVISYGVNYDGSKIGEGQTKDGMEQPEHYWDPSIAPSGIMFYTGKLWPEWTGDIFLGSLKFGFIARLDADQDYAEEQMQSDETGRVRDIREAPDGSIWFLSVAGGAVWKITP